MGMLKYLGFNFFNEASECYVSVAYKLNNKRLKSPYAKIYRQRTKVEWYQSTESALMMHNIFVAAMVCE